MRRLFWLAVGAGAGIYAVQRLRRVRDRAVDAASPAGIGRALTGVVDAIRDLADDVREGMAEREAELRDALALDATPAERTLPPERAAALIEHPFRRE